VNLGRDHRVELDPFSGPLDLLLWLIREEEVDIHDIPIARILERYLAMLQTLTTLDLDQAGEFLVLASTLMEVKSRSLMPREELMEDDELDPRFELVQKLLEYRKFKEVSEELRRRAEHWSGRCPPGPPPDVPGIPPDEVPLAEVSIFDLAFAFQRVLAEVGGRAPRSIVFDDVPIEKHMESILAVVPEEGPAPFRSLFPGDADRLRITGLFLALLELIKQHLLRATQVAPFSEILITRREPEPVPAGNPAPVAPSEGVSDHPREAARDCCSGSESVETPAPPLQSAPADGTVSG
jgi:segregation and condensation protein A